MCPPQFGFEVIQGVSVGYVEVRQQIGDDDKDVRNLQKVAGGGAANNSLKPKIMNMLHSTGSPLGPTEAPNTCASTRWGEYVYVNAQSRSFSSWVRDRRGCLAELAGRAHGRIDLPEEFRTRCSGSMATLDAVQPKRGAIVE